MNLKQLGSDSLLYAAMNMGTKLIAFLMFPIYSHYLSLSEFGMLDYLDRVTSMLTFFILFGTDSALSYFYFEKKDEREKEWYARNVLLFRVFLVLFIGVLTFLFAPQLSSLLFGEEGRVLLLYLALGVLLFDTMAAFILMVMRFQFKTLRVVGVTLLKMALVALLSYLALRLLAPSATGILLGRMAASALAVLVLLKDILPYLKPVVNKKVMMDILRYGAPLVPASLSFWVIANGNVFFLKEFSGFESVGLYGSAMKLAMMITLLTTGIQMAYRPYAMSIKDQEDTPYVFGHLYVGLLWFGSVGLLFIASVMPYVILILEESYQASYPYVALLSVAAFLNFYYLIISIGLLIKKRTKIISVVFMASSLVSLGLNVLLIPPFGIWGAVASYIASYAVANVWVFVESQKTYRVRVSGKRLAALFSLMLSSLILVAAIQVLPLSNLWVLPVWGLFLLGSAILGVRGHLMMLFQKFKEKRSVT